MEFWTGLSVGLHLGRLVAEWLEKYVEYAGILSHETVEEIDEIEKEVVFVADQSLVE